MVLARAAAFIFLASSIWALLPLTARSQLHLGSGGYGLPLGRVGVGAVTGAALLPRPRARLAPGTLLSQPPVVAHWLTPQAPPGGRKPDARKEASHDR